MVNARLKGGYRERENHSFIGAVGHNIWLKSLHSSFGVGGAGWDHTSDYKNPHNHQLPPMKPECQIKDVGRKQFKIHWPHLFSNLPLIDSKCLYTWRSTFFTNGHSSCKAPQDEGRKGGRTRTGSLLISVEAEAWSGSIGRQLRARRLSKGLQILSLVNWLEDTTEWIPVDGTPVQPRPFHINTRDHCTIQTQPFSGITGAGSQP